MTPDWSNYKLGTEYRNGVPWSLTFKCLTCGAYGLSPWHIVGCAEKEKEIEEWKGNRDDRE